MLSMICKIGNKEKLIIVCFVLMVYYLKTGSFRNGATVERITHSADRSQTDDVSLLSAQTVDDIHVYTVHTVISIILITLSNNHCLYAT